MEKVRLIFMMVVAGIVLLGFGVCIYFAAKYTGCFNGVPKPSEMPKIVSFFVSALNGTLAANLGAILGISISLKGWQGPKNTTEAFQWIAGGWYVLMLILATIFWGMAKEPFTEDEAIVVSTLPEMTKNGIGIFIAILAAVLGVQTAITRTESLKNKVNE